MLLPQIYSKGLPVFNEEEEDSTVGPTTSPNPNYIPQHCQESHLIEKVCCMTWYAI
jgi:hypothetical protein